MTKHIGIVACSAFWFGHTVLDGGPFHCGVPCLSHHDYQPTEKSRLQRRGSRLYRNIAACIRKRL